MVRANATCPVTEEASPPDVVPQAGCSLDHIYKWVRHRRTHPLPELCDRPSHPHRSRTAIPRGDRLQVLGGPGAAGRPGCGRRAEVAPQGPTSCYGVSARPDEGLHRGIRTLGLSRTGGGRRDPGLDDIHGAIDDHSRLAYANPCRMRAAVQQCAHARCDAGQGHIRTGERRCGRSLACGRTCGARRGPPKQAGRRAAEAPLVRRHRPAGGHRHRCITSVNHLAPRRPRSGVLN